METVTDGYHFIKLKFYSFFHVVNQYDSDKHYGTFSGDCMLFVNTFGEKELICANNEDNVKEHCF